MFFFFLVYRMDSRRFLSSVVVGCCLLAMKEGIAVERGHVVAGPFTTGKGPPRPGL